MPDVLYEKKNHTAVITFNKVETLNTLSSDFMGKISKAIDQAESDDDIYTIIFTGVGKAFIAGADIKEMISLNPEEIYSWAAIGGDLNLRIEELEKPTIAAINGYALGGGLELAMACDIRIVTQGTKLGLVETGLGVICGAGGTQRLPRLVGNAKAKELLFTAGTVSPEEALEIGLVNKVVLSENLMDTAIGLAEQIENNSQVAVRLAKKAIHHAENTTIEEGTLLERQLFAKSFQHEDQKIGMTAFIKGEREIQFKNK